MKVSFHYCPNDSLSFGEQDEEGTLSFLSSETQIIEAIPTLSNQHDQ